jgi:hypothetical protein
MQKASLAGLAFCIPYLGSSTENSIPAARAIMTVCEDGATSTLFGAAITNNGKSS